MVVKSSSLYKTLTLIQHQVKSSQTVSEKNKQKKNKEKHTKILIQLNKTSS